jgi:hypothetical protein
MGCVATGRHPESRHVRSSAGHRQSFGEGEQLLSHESGPGN